MSMLRNLRKGGMVATCKTASVGTSPVAAWCTAPCKGRLQTTTAVLEGTITTAPAAIAVAINGGSAIGALSIPVGVAGSGATDYPGDTSGLNPCLVNEGDFISFTPSGATGANIAATFSALIYKA